MTQYFTRIIQCPSCSKKMILDECSACNTFGAKFYTDGACKGAMYDPGSALLRCSECQSLFWREDIKDPEPSEDALDYFNVMNDPSLRNLSFARPPKRTEYPEILAMAPWKNESHEKYLRLRAWWAMNDALRSRQSAGNSLTDGSKANMTRLLELCMAEQTPSENDVIKQSELLRELGRFAESLSVLDRPFNDRYLQVVKRIRKLAKDRDACVRIVPAPPKKRFADYSEYTGPGGVVVIPGKINGLSVAKITSKAFRSATNLSSVTIPRSVTDIERNAFSFCTNLTAITVEAGNPVFKSIDGVLFNKSLTTLIQYPPGRVGDYVIPSSVNCIGWQAFRNCSGLSCVTIPHSVVRIDECAFNNASSLTSLVIPASVTSIGDGAFSNCPKLHTIEVVSENPALSSVDGVLFDSAKTRLIQYPSGKKSAYIIPDNVARIGDGAFSGCMFLTSVIIPSSVTSIGSSAFSCCTSLGSVEIPDSVNLLENSAFFGCTSLVAVTLGCGINSIEGGTFWMCSSLARVNISGGISSIKWRAFAECVSLVNFAIPDTVTNIGDSAFENCSSLTNINIPGSATINNRRVFCGCNSLTDVTLCDGVISIGCSEFEKCTSLINVSIPNSVTHISYFAFKDCTSLSKITIPGSVTRIGDSAFENCIGLREVFFCGNAPSEEVANVFDRDSKATIYYLPGSTGWGATFGGRPTVAWVR